MRTNLSFLMVILVIGATLCQAQETGQEKKWKFLIEPYMMFPSMSGTTGLRNLPDVDVDANAGDIFSKLQFGAML